MPPLRFATAREVFEAFPTASVDIESAPSDRPPLEYLRALAKGPKPDDAVAFCAYLLPRREAVWWASQSVRALLNKPTPEDEAALKAAEDWVYEPEEPRRLHALEMGTTLDDHAASTWVARAAAWSSGTMMMVGEHPGPPVTPPMTAQAAFTAIRIALGGKPNRVAEIAQCVERGVQIAEG
jgi:hypothetical protein